MCTIKSHFSLVQNTVSVKPIHHHVQVIVWGLLHCLHKIDQFKFNHLRLNLKCGMNLIAMIGLLSWVPPTFKLGKGPLNK